MTRFYYPVSRSHHAFCMAIDFGMEFERRFGKWEPEALLHLSATPEYKIYVHEDSLAILVPQVGDMLTNLGMLGWRLSAIEGDKLVFHDGPDLVYGRPAEMRIIQRSGIPFHYPEQEPE